MMHDLRFAVRQLWKAPGFTIAAVLVLTLGIGANTAVFSLVHTMLFAPPGYARPNELVQIFSQDTKNPKSFREFSYPTLNDIREQNSVFSSVAGFNVGMVGIGEKNNTRRTFVSLVSANYFEVLGVGPVLGRVFTMEEEQPGRAASVAIVSYSYWTRHNRDASILGSQVLINGRSYTIVGVLPKTFTGTLPVLSPEVWLPLSAFEFVAPNYTNDPAQTLGNRKAEQLLLIGRFKQGVTICRSRAASRTTSFSSSSFPR
jgi:putative ABC transport system permease protein